MAAQQLNAFLISAPPVRPERQEAQCRKCGTPTFRVFGATGWGPVTHYSNAQEGCWRILPPK